MNEAASSISGEKLLAARILNEAVRDAKKGDKYALDFLDPRNKLFMFWCDMVLDIDTKAFLVKLAGDI